MREMKCSVSKNRMLWWRPWVLLALCFLWVNGDRPDGYILEVRPHCGSDQATDAHVTIITDLPDVIVTADCPAGQATFTSNDQVNFKLAVSYPGVGSSFCNFLNVPGSDVYKLPISIGYGEDNGRIQQSRERFTVTCTFDPHESQNSDQQTISESLGAPMEMQINNGLDTSSSLTLTLIDILGDPIQETETVVTGRKVQLKLTSNGNASELGIRPTSCVAFDPLGNKTYSILRAGCGDGVVFKRYSGFTTDGLVSYSPYFDYYGLEGTDAVAYRCNVTICPSACDGTSCVLGRSKRSVRKRKMETISDFT